MVDCDHIDKILGTEEKNMKAEKITRKAEKIADKTLARAQGLAKEAISKFPFAGEEQKEAQGSEKESPLVNLNIKSLYALEKLDSQIRHSVVEVCFYNLKLLCQVFNSKYSQPRFREKFKENVKELSSAKSRLEDYFQHKLEEGVTVGSLFEEEEDKIDEEIEYITELLTGWESKREDASYREEISKSVPEKIDLIMLSLGKVKSTLEEEKVDVSKLINKAIDLHSERLKKNKIDVALDVAATVAKIFARNEGLLDIFCELIRNAIKHGFEDFRGEDKKIIDIKLSSSNETEKNIVISFSDNGIGIDRNKINSIRDLHLGNSGLSVVKRVVEDENFGKIKIDNGAEEGTVITIILPAEL